VFVLDLDTLKVVGRVTGVGDEAYFLPLCRTINCSPGRCQSDFGTKTAFHS